MPKEKGIIDYVSWTGAVQNILKRTEVVPEHVLTSLASTFSFETCKQIILAFFLLLLLCFKIPTQIPKIK